MNEQQNIKQVLENAFRMLSLLKREPEIDETYKEIDGDVYATISITCKDADNKVITLFRNTEKVADPQAVKDEISAKLQSQTDELQVFQERAEKVITEIDKVIPNHPAKDEAGPVPSLGELNEFVDNE